MIPESLDHALVDCYRAWNLLEKNAHRPEIVDFDLAAPRQVSPAIGRDDVMRQLRELLDQTSDLDPFWRELVSHRLRASLCFLEALSGEVTTLDDYVKTTIGVTPQRISEDEINRQREDVRKALSDLNQRRPGAANQRRRSTRRLEAISFEASDFHRFQSVFMVPDNSKLPRHFEFYREKWLARLLERLNVSIEAYRIRIDFTSEDAYWKNWISGNLAGQEMSLRINCHPRHSWYVGAAETLALHEYCGHAIQMISWHRQIEERRLPEFAGILTVHFPDQFLLEGLAESMSYWLPDEVIRLEPKSIVLRELHAYTLLVMNNLHIIANDESREAAIHYAAERSPFTKRETLVSEARDRTTHPLYRCYQYVYGVAKNRFVHAFRELGPRGSSRLIERAYGGPMTPEQFDVERERILASA